MAEIDKYSLYAAAVQDPEAEIELLTAFYEDTYGKSPTILREDFCGTFLISCEWVKRDPKNQAVAVDIDETPLAYGKKHHLKKLASDERRRLSIVKKDATLVKSPKTDIVAVSNFSSFFIKDRNQLVKYLKTVHRALKSKGIVSFDMVGGIELADSNKETKTVKMPNGTKFKYVWEQKFFDPITNEGLFYIHFEFPNGKKYKRMFRYDWRLWSIPEMRDAMRDAGFKRTYVYWEGDDDKGGGNGEFCRSEHEESCDVWIAYVVGVK